MFDRFKKSKEVQKSLVSTGQNTYGSLPQTTTKVSEKTSFNLRGKQGKEKQAGNVTKFSTVYQTEQNNQREKETEKNRKDANMPLRKK